MRSLITEAVAEDRKIPNPELQLADVTLKLRNQFLDRQIAALDAKNQPAGNRRREKVELLREQQKLRRTKTLAALAIGIIKKAQSSYGLRLLI